MKRRILTFIMLPIFLFSCHRKAAVPDVERGQIDSVVYSVGDADSLARVMDSFISAGNLYGEMVAARELGKKLRNASQFYEAIDVHKRGLVAAEKLRDTVQIVQALNNIGTNYRRLAILDEASSYHYQALTYCDQYSGSRNPDDRTARKNRVVSLNGIGNVQLTLGNADEAENAFRQALKGENELGSALGQAINYANLGSILESREMLDSARYYYGKSLEFNEKAKSDLGVSLCHAHFGRLAEKEGDYDTAIEEYRQAYDIMEGNSDVWHWLESAVSLVRAYINAGNLERASFYLAKAGKEAGRISSMEYLAEVNRLEYLISKKKGNAVKALEYYVRSREYADSVASEKNLNHIPVIMVTAKATHEDRMKGLAAGADSYLEKPFHADELAVRVSKLLEQRKLLQSKWEAVIRQGEPVEENPAANELPDADRAFVGKFTDAVNKCFETGTLDYDFIASEMCLTRSHMNRKLKAITGMTSTEYIKTMRISLAKALIDTTDMKIEAIAMRCGVDDVAYFSSLFRKATGMTPTAWRSRNRG